GDTVHPGDLLFTLKLASESIHQTQADLLKTSENIKLTQARLERLRSGGDAIAQARVIEVENEVKRLETAQKAFRAELRNRAFSSEDIDAIENGKLITELSVIAPPVADTAIGIPAHSNANEQPLAYEVRELKVELGEQVQAGQTLCHLSSHQWLAI